MYDLKTMVVAYGSWGEIDALFGEDKRDGAVWLWAAERLC